MAEYWAHTQPANPVSRGVVSNGIAAARPMGAGQPVDPLVVYGSIAAGNGKIGTCPGSFIGLARYAKTNSWGWAPITNAVVLTATDGSGRTDTKIRYIGYYGDTGCDQTTVTIPCPPVSPTYEFIIYFTNNVPATNYPVMLTGFNP